MRFSPAFLEEIRARLPVSEVVRRRVKLTKAGREWRGLSPFGNEKTPSFFVNDQKMAWFDFSAGKNGNIFDFVMATEGLSFPEAVERLAQEAGVPLPQSSAADEAQERRRAGLHEVLERAARFFEGQLKGAAGAKARAYLAGRGIAPETQQQFRLGFAPAEKYALRDALAATGASVEVMCEAGLLIHGEEVTVPYDRFRDRVMFPIADARGRVIAFGGRALDKTAPAKYLNSPETPLFHKGAGLYNIHNARKPAADAGRVVAVEGYVDVIALTAAGFPEAVAYLGTALTADQCGLLWRLAPEPILCFDGDAAGRKAAFRAVDLALPLIGPERSLRFALLPDGQDPDDLVRAGGPASMGAVLDGARPLVDMVWLRETQGPLATPEQKAAVERRLGELARQIADDTLARYYAAEFRQRLAALLGQGSPARGPREAGRGASGGFRRGGLPPPPRGGRDIAPAVSASLAGSALFRPASTGLSPREALILLVLLNQPALLEAYAETLAELELGGREADALRDGLLALLRHPPLPADAARAELERGGLSEGLARCEAVLPPATHWYVRADAALSDAEEVLRQALALHRKARALHRELQSATEALAQETSAQNLARLKDVQEQIATLAGMEATVEGFGVASGRSAGAL
jgi:DNA primase